MYRGNSIKDYAQLLCIREIFGLKEKLLISTSPNFTLNAFVLVLIDSADAFVLLRLKSFRIDWQLRLIVLTVLLSDLKLCSSTFSVPLNKSGRSDLFGSSSIIDNAQL
jgi:hypothetical protein